MSSAICSSSVVIGSASRLLARKSGGSRAGLTAARPRSRRVAVATQASVWSEMSGYMKKKCEAAAMLEEKDVEAGRAAWIALDREAPGARMAYQDNRGARGTNDLMDKFCAEDPNAEECRVFDE